MVVPLPVTVLRQPVADVDALLSAALGRPVPGPLPTFPEMAPAAFDRLVAELDEVKRARAEREFEALRLVAEATHKDFDSFQAIACEPVATNLKISEELNGTLGFIPRPRFRVLVATYEASVGHRCADWWCRSRCQHQ